MRAVIVGAGKTGTYLARDMAEAGHKVVLLEKNRRILESLPAVDGAEVRLADGCDPERLEMAGAAEADLVVAVTGDDEDNLVVSWLAKYVFNVKRVIARVNNPKNSWLYTEEWGVDAPVSAMHVISKLIEEEARLSELVTLVKLQQGQVSLVETTLTAISPANGRRVNELALPEGATIVALLRNGQVVLPAPEIVFREGDAVLAVVPTDEEEGLVKVLQG